MEGPDPATLVGLARTVLLLRDHVRPEVPDRLLAEALLRTRVAVVGDRPNLSMESSQHALVTTALLIARWGGIVHVVVPDVPLLGSHPPLQGDRLEPALLDVLDDLIPGVQGSVTLPSGGVDVAILIGDTSWSGRAARVLRLQADAWCGAIVQGGGSPWRDYYSPFGALAAAGMAAGEGFKAAVHRLRSRVMNPRAFDELFAPSLEAAIRLAPEGTPAPSRELGAFDCVSGGAIIQAALYALSRIPGSRGTVRVFEPEIGDLTNLNRYSLLRRSRTTVLKAVDLAEAKLSDVRVHPIVQRYDASLRLRLGPHAPAVLVGVDDIPSRWEVQASRPLWLGVGATTHYSAMASYHVHGLGCARCLHPRDDPDGGPIPTVSFVSHWAGLWLASLFAREQINARPPVSQQSIYLTSLRAESPAALWFGPVPILSDCPFECGAPAGGHRQR
jgi:hypothetical protein